MATTNWTVATSGNVTDEAGTVVGSGNGAGIITINNAAIVNYGSAGTNTLNIGPGLTIKMGTISRFRANCSTGSGFKGTINFNGTAAAPILVTSNAGTPAPNDWNGIEFLGAVQTNVVTFPTVYMSYTTVEYTSTCVTSQSGAGHVLNKFRADYCTFRRGRSGLILNSGGQGGLPDGAWYLSYCVFSTCPGDYTSGTHYAINCSTGGTPAEIEKAKVYMDHCSFLVNSSANSGHAYCLILGTKSRASITNSILQGTNSGSQDSRAADIHATDTIFTANNNFLQVDALEDYVLQATDQSVDPNLFNDTVCASYDLRPDATVGSPVLLNADSGGWYVGALEPYNIPSGDVAPVGTTGVWAGRKQRVYPVSFGSDPTKARAIRIGIASQDLRGVKHLAGILLESKEERLK